jgi:phosphohistidine phosphatase SixA
VDGPEPPVARTTATEAAAPSPSAAAGLVERLRQGGFILYARHAATESTQDDPSVDLSDPGTQRRLSDEGREQARLIGREIRRLGIPIGDVLASPYDRTRETAALAFGADRVRDSRTLINEIYPGTDDEELARGLRELLRTSPGSGANTVLVSHGFNLAEATGVTAGEGDVVIFDPRAPDPLAPVAIVAPGEWRGRLT